MLSCISHRFVSGEVDTENLAHAVRVKLQHFHLDRVLRTRSAAQSRSRVHRDGQPDLGGNCRHTLFNRQCRLESVDAIRSFRMCWYKGRMPWGVY